MKVALITSYCLDSSIPLAKHLGDESMDVFLYGIIPQYDQNTFVIDFNNDKQPNGFIDKDILQKRMGTSLCGYMSKINFDMYIYPAGAGKKAYFNDIYHAYKFSQHIIAGKFDKVHLIHTANRFSLLLLYFLKAQPIVQTLHEVTAHNGDNNNYNIKILNKLVARNIPVIFNSNISKERFLNFRNSLSATTYNTDIYKMIRFSLYETYLYFEPVQYTPVIKVPADIPIILHFGRVVPYKGIELLIDAIKIIQLRQPVHLIVAGGGDAYFNFEGIKSYEFLNYSINNELVVELIKNCTLVVCPYRSASQSGIPMTVFPFNKPIIASNIGGFKEIIENNLTGLLVENLDSASFASAIEILLANKQLRDTIAVNIKNKFSSGEFSWTNIATSTIQFYKQSSN